MKHHYLKFLRMLKLTFGLHKKVYFNDLKRVDPVSPGFGYDRGLPIDRYYIEKFLRKNRKHIKGKILEIAEDTYSRKYADYSFSEELVFETMNYSGKETKSTIIGDLTNLETLSVDCYDCFICTQTYNFIFDVQKAIEGSFRILKPGGVILATVGGISQISRYDMDRWGDYWRFTDKSISMLFKNAGFSNVNVVTMGNSSAACGFLQGLVVEDFPAIEILDHNDNDYQIIIGVLAVK